MHCLTLSAHATCSNKCLAADRSDALVCIWAVALAGQVRAPGLQRLATTARYQRCADHQATRALARSECAVTVRPTGCRQSFSNQACTIRGKPGGRSQTEACRGRTSTGPPERPGCSPGGSGQGRKLQPGSALVGYPQFRQSFENHERTRRIRLHGRCCATGRAVTH